MSYLDYRKPLFPEWLGWFLFAAFLVGVFAFICWADSQAEADCNARGGTYVHTGRYNSVCFRKGTVVE